MIMEDCDSEQLPRWEGKSERYRKEGGDESVSSPPSLLSYSI